MERWDVNEKKINGKRVSHESLVCVCARVCDNIGKFDSLL